MTAVSSLQLVRREQRGAGCSEIVKEFGGIGRGFHVQGSIGKTPHLSLWGSSAAHKKPVFVDTE